MTKVEAQYEFTRPFEDRFLQAVENAHGVYGLEALRLRPDLSGMTVVYDASRMRPADVDHTLSSAGLPVRRIGT